ncbi:MAG: hypothetical protein IPK57_09245 [Chitinophagaceae bacterium]|nr:hypothetical protein [Chitinophagaceae bacterium]
MAVLSVMDSLSLATGYHTETIGYSSVAMGDTTKTRARASLVLGRFNDTIASSNPSQWITTDPVFIIGNGTADNARKNAVTILKNAKTGINMSDPIALLDIKRTGWYYQPGISGWRLLLHPTAPIFIITMTW